MFEDRIKLLVRSIKTSCIYHKNVKPFLTKLLNSEEKLEKIEDFLGVKDYLDIFLNMVETGEMFIQSKELYWTYSRHINYMYNKLSIEEKRELYKKAFSGKYNEQISDYFLLDQMFVDDDNELIIGDLLYDVSFLKNFPSYNSLVIENLFKTVDYDRILSDDELFECVLSKTTLFSNVPNVDFKLSYEQAVSILKKGYAWPLDFYSIKEKDLANIIIENPIDLESILDKLSDESRNSPLITLSLLLAGKFDYLQNKNLFKENLFYAWILRDEYTKNLTKNLGIMDEEKDKLLFFLSQFAEKLGIEREIMTVNMRKENDVKKMISLFLHKLNEHYDYKLSEQNIDEFINNNPNVLEKIFYSIDGVDTRIDLFTKCGNLYFALCNDVLDLFSEMDLTLSYAPGSFSRINREMVDTLGNDVMRNILLFPATVSILSILQKENKLGMYKKLIDVSEDLNISFFQLSNILVFSCYSYSELIEKMITNNNLTKDNVIKLINLTKLKTLVEFDYTLSIEENFKKIDVFCDKNIEDVDGLNFSRELFCQRFFKLNYSDVKELYDSFEYSINDIKTDEIKTLFNVLKTLIEEDDVNKIKDAYKVFKDNAFYSDYSGFLNIIDKLKEETVMDLGKTQLSSKTGILDYTGRDFEFLIHVVGAYGSVIEADSLYESWNSSKKGYNYHLCTSLINSNHLGHARTKKDSVILGFTDVSVSDVQSMGPYDLYSRAYLSGVETSRNVKYCNSTKLVNYTRSLHNEVVINRNTSAKEKRQPNCIICFDEINKESRKASEQFKIPIVFIDTKKHLSIKMQEIENLKIEFALNHSLDIATKIIHMQETLKCGFLCNHKDLALSTFDADYITNNILFLVHNCDSVREISHIEKLVEQEKKRKVADYREVTFDCHVAVVDEAIKNKKNSFGTTPKLSEFQETRLMYQKEEGIKIKGHVIDKDLAIGNKKTL